MKELLLNFILLTTGVVMFCGCWKATKQKEYTTLPITVDTSYYAHKNDNQVYQELIVITIDSCEYLVGGSGRDGVITHKGNCKNCNK